MPEMELSNYSGTCLDEMVQKLKNILIDKELVEARETGVASEV